MVHVRLSDDVHKSLCRLKVEAREFWVKYWKDHDSINMKGRVSIEEVVKFLLQTRY